jgi:hypothetical protein
MTRARTSWCWHAFIAYHEPEDVVVVASGGNELASLAREDVLAERHLKIQRAARHGRRLSTRAHQRLKTLTTAAVRTMTVLIHAGERPIAKDVARIDPPASINV